MSEENQEQRLYAGKYKTIEEVEAAANNSAKLFQEKVELEKQFEGFKKVPETYELPEDIKDFSRADEIKALAKSSGLNQSHFENLVREMHKKTQDELEGFEA